MSKPQGQLIALEGANSSELHEASPRLLRHLTGGHQTGGVSRWDASNTFYELRLAKAKRLRPSPRTLLLLYAYDLSFRLRWEIQPAVQDGLIVVAVPYVESATAFGEVTGLPRWWLTELFSFAPKPAQCFRLREKKKDADRKVKSSQGFLEFCCSLLSAGSDAWHPPDLLRRCIGYLEELESKNLCQKLPRKLG